MRGVADRVVGRQACAHGQSQKNKSTRTALARARVSDHPAAKFVDFTLARDAEKAEKHVAEAHDIRADLRDRLVAIHEDL